MANTTIKVSQLPNIGLNLNANTLMLAVSTNGSYSTDKINLGSLANYVLSEAGNLLQECFVSQLAYSVTNSAQPNITSVGTLNINNLHISGGDNGYVLQTDGMGNLNWTAMSGSGSGSPGGANGQIQFNSNGSFDGTTFLTYSGPAKTLNAFNLTISNTAFILGNLQVFNNFTGNYIFANLINANSFTTLGNMTANYFIGNGSLLTGLVANAVGSGPNLSVQFNLNGAFAGDGNFKYNTDSSTLEVTNLKTSNSITTLDIDFTGNITGGQKISANYLFGDGSNISNISGVNFAENSNIANIANITNSVAVANVVGIGNIATLNLDGNSSNVLLGNGKFSNAPFNSNTLIWTTAPLSNISEGNQGQVAYDNGGNLFICVSTNTWSKISGTTSW